MSVFHSTLMDMCQPLCHFDHRRLELPIKKLILPYSLHNFAQIFIDLVMSDLYEIYLMGAKFLFSISLLRCDEI